MRIATIIFAAATCAIAITISASPAATTNWVKEYVATNRVKSASYEMAVSNAVTGAVVVSVPSSATVYTILSGNATNAVELAVQQSISEMSPRVDSAMNGGIQ